MSAEVRNQAAAMGGERIAAGGPGRIEAGPDRGAYLRGIDARRLRSGDPRRRRLGRRRRAPPPHGPTRGPGSSRDCGGSTPPLALARRRLRGRGRARYRLGLCVLALGANGSFVRKASSAASLFMWEGGNEDGDGVYPSPAGGEVSFYGPFYGPTIFRIAPVVPAVFAMWSVLSLSVCLFMLPNPSPISKLPLHFLCEILRWECFFKDPVESGINSRTSGAFYSTICLSSAYF